MASRRRAPAHHRQSGAVRMLGPAHYMGGPAARLRLLETADRRRGTPQVCPQRHQHGARTPRHLRRPAAHPRPVHPQPTAISSARTAHAVSARTVTSGGAKRHVDHAEFGACARRSGRSGSGCQRPHGCGANLVESRGDQRLVGRHGLSRSQSVESSMFSDARACPVSDPTPLHPTQPHHRMSSDGRSLGTGRVPRRHTAESRRNSCVARGNKDERMFDCSSPSRVEARNCVQDTEKCSHRSPRASFTMTVHWSGSRPG